MKTPTDILEQGKLANLMSSGWSLWHGYTEPCKRLSLARLALSPQLQSGTWMAKTGAFSVDKSISKQPGLPVLWHNRVIYNFWPCFSSCWRSTEIFQGWGCFSVGVVKWKRTRCTGGEYWRLKKTYRLLLWKD